MFGWTIEGELPPIKKSVVAMAPHTSYWDAVIGKLVLLAFDQPHKLLGKKELFFFPMNLIMRCIGAMPIRGIKGQNSILTVAGMLREAENLHVVICPEGGFAPTDHWNPGFIYIAQRAQVPIVLAYLDYKQRKGGILTTIEHPESVDEVLQTIAQYFAPITARYPERFKLPTIKKQRIL